ncbi:hopanoid biosynthesis associated protein HpnK [Calothrix sp. NIES-4071]|nr:hopanoid biosynthesis associated protein HpnK [Calothrix sp. NIES-4071]BAZ63985.1 hopanoid biosynthesis associated protein HpnK [Calothrix sp. NIES-4105]
MSNLTNNHRVAIINGDDFGFSDEVNQAIIKAHQHGVLTSTSLMVTGAAFSEAVELAHENPNLGVGLHLVLVCGRSALPKEQVPHLVDENCNFSNDPTFAGLRYQFNRQARIELQQEIRAQLEKFRATGLPLSHVDGHLHLHVHPVVINILADMAAEFGIKYIRLPSEELKLNLELNQQNLLTKLVWSGVFGRLRDYGASILKSKNINFTERVYGLLQTGSVSEQYLCGLIPQIQANRIEIYSHPAFSGAGEVELKALLSEQVRNALRTEGFELTNYHKLS